MVILIPLLAGFVATAFMCFFMEILTRARFANADMVRAVGSLFTKSYENSLIPGLIVQFGFGIVFGFIYFAILSVFTSGSVLSGMTAGLVMGFFHGMVVSLALVIAVAEHHPLEQFQNAGLTVAASHLGGHIIYGFVVGLIFGISGIRFF